jgi:hypothetical protein
MSATTTRIPDPGADTAPGFPARSGDVAATAERPRPAAVGPASIAPAASSDLDPGPPGGALVYRFEARLTEMRPRGRFPEGIRFEVPFEGRVTHGPLTGARISGVDHLLIRPDGVAVIDAPETLERDGTCVLAHARGYVLPPAGLPAPPPEAMLAADFTWPDQPFTVRGFALLRTSDPAHDSLNRTVAALRGRVNLRTGELSIVATAV